MKKLLMCLLLLAVAACSSNDDEKTRLAKLEAAKSASNSVLGIIKAQADLYAAANPNMPEQRKVNLAKAIAAAEIANKAVQGLQPGDGSAGTAIGQFAGVAQYALEIIPMKPEVKFGVSTGLIVIQAFAPLIKYIPKDTGADEVAPVTEPAPA